MSCSPPSAKQAKYSCDVNDLADSDLEEIFKRLPPFERLIVSEVCRRWHQISRKAWLDVKSLDLCEIPDKHFRPIISQCPNFQSLFAAEKSFGLNELTLLAKFSSLSRLSLFDCEFEINPVSGGLVQNVFSGDFENIPLTELTLYDALFFIDETEDDYYQAYGVEGLRLIFDATNLPVSLTRLQLTGLHTAGFLSPLTEHFLEGIERLENLECFILHTVPQPSDRFHSRDPDGIFEFVDNVAYDVRINIFEKICRMRNLKELCVGPAWALASEVDGLGLSLTALPKLEVLFLSEIMNDENAEDLAALITGSHALRILVLSGVAEGSEPIELPARKRFPRGFGSDPLPVLHIFVGKDASEAIRFTESTSDAAIIHPISAPIPEFLVREDIAPIFQGVWVADKIKELAKYGGKLWQYEAFDAASSVEYT